MTREELDRRLAEADRARTMLRKTTIELREFGRQVLDDLKKERSGGRPGPDQRPPRGA